MKNPFLYDVDDYQRDMDIIGNAQKTVAKYLSVRSKKPFEMCLDWTKKKITKESLKNPKLKALVREARGDRNKAVIPYLDYVNRVNETGRILCPNMVCYSNPEDEESYLSGFVDYNMDRRSKIKKEGQAAEMAGNKAHAAYCNLEQGNTKFFNNSISGAQMSPYNALYNASAHTSLTSTCRSVTSYANSLIEKFLGGRRHYYSPEIVKADIAFISSRCNLNAIQRCRDLYGISPVSVDYVMVQIERSVNKAWGSDKEYAEIRSMLEGLTENELIGYSLTGDWRAMIETQDHVIRAMYDKMMDRPTEPHPDPDSVFNSVDDDVKAMVGLLTSDYLAGKTPKHLKKEDPKQFAIYANTIVHCQNVLHEYRGIFKTFVSFMYLTTGIFSFPVATRSEVIASDTDSAIFSTRRFIKWYTGSDGFNLKHTSSAAITAYITSQLVAHALAVLSAQIGVPKDLLFRLTMKMEFYIPVMATVATKTYMMLEAAKEGNVYEEPEITTKGVLLVSSKVQAEVAKIRDKYYEELLQNVYKEKVFTPKEVIAPIAKLEHILLNNVRSGSVGFHRSADIKGEKSYKKPESSNYRFYSLWNEVFGRKYGTIDTLPAQCVKVNVNLPNKQAINNFIESLPMEMRAPMKNWFEQRNVIKFTNFIIPVELLPEGKVIPELMSILDTGRIISDTLGGMYLAATGFGIHVLDEAKEYTASMIMDEKEATALDFVGVEEMLAK